MEPSHDITAPVSLMDYGIGEIARRMAGVAAFIKDEYCRTTLDKRQPIYGFMQNLYDHLVNYDWPLVRPEKFGHTLLPGERPVVDALQAAKAMQALVPFFEARAEQQNPGVVEASIAAALRFAAQYTFIMIGSTNYGEVQAEEGEIPDLTPLPTPPLSIAESAAVTDAVEKSSSYNTAETQESPTLEPECPVSGTPSIDDVLDPQVITAQDLDPILRGRRLDSRSWFEDDAHFAELIAEPKQWVEPEPAYYFAKLKGRAPQWVETEAGDYCTVPSSSPDGPFHFCDATPLGISALKAIALRHPLDPLAVRELDIDVLRFVRLALWDWTNGHPYRVLEKESLSIVRAEIAERQVERKTIEETSIEVPEPSPETPLTDEKPSGPGIEETSTIDPSEFEPLKAQLQEVQAQLTVLMTRMTELEQIHRDRGSREITEEEEDIPEVVLFRGRGPLVQRPAPESDAASEEFEFPSSELPSIVESDEDDWLAPLTTTPRRGLRSSRGRPRIERRQEPELDWRSHAPRVPSRIVTMKKCERIFDSLNSVGDKKTLDLDNLPSLLESELVVKEV